MNIVIYVNYGDSQFNKDFKIANELLKVHNVFFAINDIQLNDLYPKCDILVRGLSAKSKTFTNLNFYDLNEFTYLEDIKMFDIGN